MCAGAGEKPLGLTTLKVKTLRTIYASHPKVH